LEAYYTMWDVFYCGAATLIGYKSITCVRFFVYDKTSQASGSSMEIKYEINDILCKVL
jgi:GT2 family glycosyltransferase